MNNYFIIQLHWDITLVFTNVVLPRRDKMLYSNLYFSYITHCLLYFKQWYLFAGTLRFKTKWQYAYFVNILLKIRPFDLAGIFRLSAHALNAIYAPKVASDWLWTWRFWLAGAMTLHLTKGWTWLAGRKRPRSQVLSFFTYLQYLKSM